MPNLWTVEFNKEGQKTIQKPFSSVDLSDDIFLVFGIDVSKDNDCFSKYVCHKCKASISTWKKHGSVTTIKAARTVAQTTNAIWCDFDENKSLMNCSLCYHRLISLAKGNMKAGMSPQTQREKSLKTIQTLATIYRLKTQH